MQQCERCGTSVAEQAGFCTACGHRLATGGAGDPTGAEAAPRTYAGVLVPPDPGPRRRPWLAAAAGLAAVALVAVGFALGRGVDAGDDPGPGGGETAVGEEDGDEAGDLPRLVAGDVTELEAEEGAATAELLVARSPGVVLRVDDGVVSVADEAGATVADDADSDVLDLAPGLYTLRVDDVDGETVVLTVGEVVDGPLPGSRALAGELNETAPVRQATVEPTVYHAWRLVDASADEVDAVLHDVTDLADGEDPTDAPVVCDGFDDECRLEAGRSYLVRIRALNLPAAYDLTFEEVVARSGPASVLVDGEPAPQAVALDGGEPVTVDLAIGHRGDVVLWVTPLEGIDVAVAVAGREVDGAGSGAAEAIRVTADEVEQAFGSLELEVTARGGAGTAFVTAERR